jgi:hypothetical protein
MIETKNAIQLGTHRFKGATSCGLRAPHAHSAWGPHWIAPKGNLA